MKPKASKYNPASHFKELTLNSAESHKKDQKRFEKKDVTCLDLLLHTHTHTLLSIVQEKCVQG